MLSNESLQLAYETEREQRYSDCDNWGNSFIFIDLHGVIDLVWVLNPPSPVQWKWVSPCSSLSFNLQLCVVVVEQWMSGLRADESLLDSIELWIFLQPLINEVIHLLHSRRSNQDLSCYWFIFILCLLHQFPFSLSSVGVLQGDEVLTVIKMKAQWPAWQPLNVWVSPATGLETFGFPCVSDV